MAEPGRSQRWWRKPMVWLSAFLISLVVAVAPVVAEKVFFASPTPSGPLTVQASVDRNPCIGGWLMPVSPAELAAPSNLDWDAWASRHGGVPAGSRVVTLTVRGTSEAAVTIQDISPRIVTWEDPPIGTHSIVGCGGPSTYRWIAVDLDRSPPAKTPGFDRWLAEEYFPGQRWEPYRFPYTVDISEPEMFFITATTIERDVRWVIDLTWVSGNERGVIVVDDNGEPFRLAGPARATAACTWGEGGGLVEGPCSGT